jgi:nicotinate-nucleotide adenylyltransferase
MEIGLYFGSFNPIHHGHLIVASHVLQNEEFDQVWFVVSPQNPFKKESGLLNAYQRLYLTRLATDGVAGFRVSDVEFGLPVPSYTINTVEYLENKYPDHRFSMLIGSDSLQNIDKWKRSQDLFTNRRVIIYPREGHPVPGNAKEGWKTCNAPMMNISASLIRRIIKNNDSIRYYVPENVRKEIEMGGYYR